MFIGAKCLKLYQDKNGNDFALMVSEWGDNFGVNLKYAQTKPEVDGKYICSVKAAQFEGKAFLAYDITRRLS